MGAVIQVIRPQVEIEMAGVDITDRYVIREGIRLEWTSDFPELATFTASSLTLYLKNQDDAFSPTNPSNFFTDNSLPQHGYKTQVIVRIGVDDNLPVAFVGIVEEINITLDSTRAQIRLLDLSTLYRRDAVDDFGEQETDILISDIDGYNADYSTFRPLFKLPIAKSPISIGSVEVSDPVDVEVVPSIRSEGKDLSYENVEVDHNSATVLFESEPPDEEDQNLVVSWKHPFLYKRPDTLARMLLKHSDFYDDLGYTDDSAARIGIPQAVVRNDNEENFSSHSRPRAAEGAGVVRWLSRDLLPNDAHPTNNSAFWYFCADHEFFEYDEYQDEYRLVSHLILETEEAKSIGAYSDSQISPTNPSRSAKMVFFFSGATGPGTISIAGEVDDGSGGYVTKTETIKVDASPAASYTSRRAYRRNIAINIDDVSGGTLEIDFELENIFTLFQFTTVDHNIFYFLATNTASGDSAETRTEKYVRIYKYTLSSDTWEEIADETDEYPQMAVNYDLGGRYYVGCR